MQFTKNTSQLSCLWSESLTTRDCGNIFKNKLYNLLSGSGEYHTGLEASKIKLWILHVLLQLTLLNMAVVILNPVWVNIPRNFTTTSIKIALIYIERNFSFFSGNAYAKYRVNNRKRRTNFVSWNIYKIKHWITLVVTQFIISMTTLLDADWLRGLQLLH